MKNVTRIFINRGNLESLLILAMEGARNRFDLMFAVTFGLYASRAGYRAIEKLARNVDVNDAFKLELIIAYAFEGYLEQAMRNYKDPKDIAAINELLAEVRTQYYYVDVRLRALDRSAPEQQEMVKFLVRRKQSLARTAAKIANLENDLSRLATLQVCRGIFEEELAIFNRELGLSILSSGRLFAGASASEDYLGEVKRIALFGWMAKENIVAIDLAIAAGSRHIKNILANPDFCNCPLCQTVQLTILETLGETLPAFLNELRDENKPFPLLSMDQRNHLADTSEFLVVASQAKAIIDDLERGMTSAAANEFVVLDLLREEDEPTKPKGAIVEPRLFVLAKKGGSKGEKGRGCGDGECRCDNDLPGSCGGKFDKPDLTAASAHPVAGCGCKRQRVSLGPIPEEDREKAIVAAERLLGFPLDIEERERFLRTGTLHFRRFVIRDL